MVAPDSTIILKRMSQSVKSWGNTTKFSAFSCTALLNSKGGPQRKRKEVTRRTPKATTARRFPGNPTGRSGRHRGPVCSLGLVPAAAGQFPHREHRESEVSIHSTFSWIRGLTLLNQFEGEMYSHGKR